MPTGPGKYDRECETIMNFADADAVLLIVLGGNKGSGFSMTITANALGLDVPGILRKTADELERSIGHS